MNAATNHPRPPDTLAIGEMCAAFGVTARTLRFYEAKELLFPIRDGLARWFTRRDRGRLRLILRGKRFGFRLEEIRQLLALREQDGRERVQLIRTYDIAVLRLREMEERRAALDAAIAELRAEMVWAEGVLSGADPARPAAE